MDFSPCRLPCKASGGKYADFNGNLYHDSKDRINVTRRFPAGGKRGGRAGARDVIFKRRGTEEASLALCYM